MDVRHQRGMLRTAAPQLFSILPDPFKGPVVDMFEPV
jgi:hypothetical protein